MAENNGRASGRAASRAIRLRHQFSVLSSQFPCAWGGGNAEFSLPRLKRLFQFHASRRFQQYDIAFASLAREPLARLFGRRDEFRFHTHFASRFHHRLRQATHAEQEIKFTAGLTSSRISCNVTPALAMQTLAGRAEFQHFTCDYNPATGGHGGESVDGSHKRLRT